MPQRETQGNIGSGWSARLKLGYKYRPERTVLAQNKHHGPLMVQRPLYPEGEVCHTYILHPPGGVVGGDQLEIDIHAGKETDILITTPGATKFYRSTGATAIQNQHIKVDEGATVEWFPQENIIFPGAEAEISTTFDTGSSSTLIGWEILCLGLPVNNQVFDKGKLATSLIIRRKGIPLLTERLRLQDGKGLLGSAGLRGYPVIATFVATGCTNNILSTLRELSPHEKNVLYGVTLLNDMLVARYLGYSTFAARDLFINIWRLLRPDVTGRPACLPRIWAT